MPPTTLIGRDAELRMLLDDFAAARSGGARSVLIRGPAGAGARGLVERFRVELGGRRLAHRWLATRGRPGDTAYAGLAALLPRDGDGLTGLMVDLVSVPVEARPAVIGDRLARVLGSDGPPLVVAVDQADQLDRRAMVALATAVRVLAKLPFLLVATIEGDGQWPADRIVNLGPLNPGDARLLAERLAADDVPRARQLEALSGGLPGLMVSLSTWPDPHLPAADQLAAVHSSAAALVVAAGIADGCLPPDDLADAAGSPPGLVQVLRSRWVLKTGPTGGLEASQPWIQVARRMLAPSEVPGIAARVASALAAASAPWQVRAAALEEAGDPSAEAEAWLAAAAREPSDSDDHAECLRRALKASWASRSSEPILARADMGSTGWGLTHDCVDALLAVGRADDALDVLDLALASTSRRDSEGLARLLTQRHRALLHAGRHLDSDVALDQALAMLPSLADPTTEAEIRTLDSMRLALQSPAKAAEQAERAVHAASTAVANSIGSDRASSTRAGALGAHALTLALVGQMERSLVLFDQALAVAEESRDRALETRIAANRIFVLWRAGDLHGMEAMLNAELARLGRSGLVEAAGGQLLVGRAVVLHGLGRWDELAEHLESTLADPQRLTAQVELLLRLVAVELLADRGFPNEARASLEELMALPGAKDPEIAYEVMSVRLALAMVSNLPRAETHALATEASALARELSSDPFAAAKVRVGVLRLLGWTGGRPAGPVPLVGPEVDAKSAGTATYAPDTGSGPPQPAPAELVALLAEERAWRTGTGWPESARAWKALPMPYRQAWALLSRGHAAAGAGEEETALSLVDQAQATGRALNAGPLVDAADRLARKLGRRSGRTEGVLTAREGDVVAQVCLGRTNREIARALGMSERTVGVHLTRIFAKLGAGTRGEVAHIALHRGLISQSAGSSRREEQV